MFKRKFQVLLAVLLIGSVLLAACAPAAPGVEPAAEVDTGEFDWKQVEGTEITVFLNETPMALAVRTHIDEFTELTGIDLDFLVVAEDQY